MLTSVFCRYVLDGLAGPYWIVGVKPFGLDETAIETRVHYTQRTATDDYRGRIAAIQY